MSSPECPGSNDIKSYKVMELVAKWSEWVRSQKKPGKEQGWWWHPVLQERASEIQEDGISITYNDTVASNKYRLDDGKMDPKYLVFYKDSTPEGQAIAEAKAAMTAPTEE